MENDRGNIPVQKPKVYPQNTQSPQQTQYPRSQYPNSQYPQKRKSSTGMIISLSVLLAALVVGLVFLIPMLSGQESSILGSGKKTRIAALSTNSDYGTVTGGGSYKNGEEVTLTAVPKDGCMFAGWSDGYAEPTRTVTAGEENSYTAVFYGPLSDWTESVPDDAVVTEEKSLYKPDKGATFTSESSTAPQGCVLVTSTKRLVSTESFYVPDYWPSGFDTSHDLYDELQQDAPTASELRDVTAGSEGYIYYHWCRGDRVAPKPPTNRKVATSRSDEFDTFHAYYSTRDPMASGDTTEGTYHAGSVVPNPSDYGAYHQPNTDCCCDSYWFFDLPVTRYNADIYEIEYVYECDGTPMTERPSGLDCTEVTCYRYRPQ